MRQEVPLSNCVGKTIEAVEFECAGPQLIITFTDGTFSTVQAEHDSWGDDGAEIVEGKLDPIAFGPSMVVRLGIMTQEEVDQYNKEQREKQWEEKEKADRVLYEQLKARFEGTSAGA